MNEDATYGDLNGSNETHRTNSSYETMMNGNNSINSNLNRPLDGGCGSVCDDSLDKHVDHIYLSGEEEEKR